MNSVQFVQELIFMQGDDAREIFDIMYPSTNRWGSDKTMRQALDHLISNLDPVFAKPIELDMAGASGQFRTKDHILMWNYPFNWIVLYRRLTKAQARELEEEQIELVSI